MRTLPRQDDARGRGGRKVLVRLLIVRVSIIITISGELHSATQYVIIECGREYNVGKLRLPCLALIISSPPYHVIRQVIEELPISASNGQLRIKV